MAQTRSIFEEVSETKRDAAVATTRRDENTKPVRIWLWILFALVVLMIVIGGLTRLTDSGLSIVDWDLVRGTIPPLNANDWQAYFAEYQKTEEFRQVNSAMSLAEFKSIFWWEWGHRQLGRFIGTVWIIGFLWFWLRKAIRRDRIGSIFLLGVLIGLQGVVGILMVKSGYIGSRVDVASYALATHLGMAFIILGLIYWNVKKLALTPAQLVEARRHGNPMKARDARWLAGLIFVQILLGALVAGIDAGRSYTDWPFMGGEFFSSDSFIYEPVWRNFFESPALVQFMHRMSGYLIAVLGIYFWISNRNAVYKSQRAAVRHVGIIILIQVSLGIVTLIKGAPVGESLVHQIGAIMLWIFVLSSIFAFAYPKQVAITA